MLVVEPLLPLREGCPEEARQPAWGKMGQEEEAGPRPHKPHRLWGPANRNNVKGYEEMRGRACVLLREGCPEEARQPAWGNGTGGGGQPPSPQASSPVGAGQ